MPHIPDQGSFHPSSPRGIRNRSDLELSLHIPENVSEKKDQVTLLKDELEIQGITAHLLHDSPFLTLDSLISQIEGPLPTGNPEYYIRSGILPFQIASKTQGKDHFVVAIPIYNKNSEEVVTGTATRMKIDELGELAPGSASSLTDYVLLQSNDFAEIVAKVNDPKAREGIFSLDGETSSREVFYHLLLDGIKNGASDVHIESMGGSSRIIRFRVDGVLSDRNYVLSEEAQRCLVNVIKNQSGMDITEKRKPQDGVIMFDDQIRERYPRLEGYSVRAATMPALHDESVVLRILQYASNQIELNRLGFPTDVFQRLHEQILSPYGLLLVTGPTGSGKTTTLYSILQTLNTREKKIITAEDPIEMAINGIVQIQVDNDAGRGFEAILKGGLRQDPDIILVGEIRDQETAELAMRAANTGHLVLSTLHTNDAISSLLRLYEFNIPKSEIQASFLAALSQRLVRKLCTAESCREQYDASAEVAEWIGICPGSPLYLAKEGGIIAGKSCTSCKGTGFKGRTVIGEIWIPGDEERILIYDGVTSHQKFFDQASKQGMIPMVVAGIEKVLEQSTTMEELRKAIPAAEFTRRRDLIASHLQTYQAREEQGARAYK